MYVLERNSESNYSSVKTRGVLSQSPPRKQYIVKLGIYVMGGGQDDHTPPPIYIEVLLHF